ncbi:hypothetical protein EON63_15000 [archaeon]|nr:MAG: hypothetical protein EON63_15000 [archaeon]
MREGLHKGISALDALELKAAQLNIPVDEVIDTTETPEQIIERQRQFLLYLYDDLTQYARAIDSGDRTLNIVCISHGAFIKRFLINYANAQVDSGIENCSVSIMNVEWRSKEDFTCSAKKDEINVRCEAAFIP